MINAEQKQEIQEAIKFCYDEIVESGEYEEHYCDSDITHNKIEKGAIDNVTDNLQSWVTLDINLNDVALKEQEKEIINYIENG